MERVVRQGRIQWPAEQAEVILIRLARIAQEVALAFGGDNTIH